MISSSINIDISVLYNERPEAFSRNPAPNLSLWAKPQDVLHKSHNTIMSRTMCSSVTANLRTKILDFTGFDSSIMNINVKGWNSHVHKDLPGYFESTNLSRDDLSREIGRKRHLSVSDASLRRPKPARSPWA